MGASTVAFARRNGLLTDGETGFYGYEHVLPTLTDWRRLLDPFPTATQVTVFGELYGGKYPHVDVEPDARWSKPVQSSIWYCPDKRFSAFDVCVDGVFLNVHAASETCVTAGIPYLPVVKCGSRTEVLAWALKHCADVVEPQWYGAPSSLPQIPGNACEGWVVRPVQDTYCLSDCRVMVKVKNPAFGEGGSGGGITASATVANPENDETNAALQSVTAARVANVLGKELETDVVIRNFRNLARLVWEDVAKDVAAAGVHVERVRTKAVHDAIAPLIRAYVRAGR
jgi:Rnl2 family RNA ligase